jgi:hypothetical protein
MFLRNVGNDISLEVISSVQFKRYCQTMNKSSILGVNTGLIRFPNIFLVSFGKSYFFSLRPLKRKARLMRSPVCLSVCLFVCFNLVLSTIPKWRTFELLRLMQNLHQSTWDHEILYTDRSSKDEQLLIRQFLSKTKKYEHGGCLNVKIHSLFCGDNS